VAELADAADLKSYVKISNSGFTFKLELLCQLPKSCFIARVPFGDNLLFLVYRQISVKILALV